MASKKKTASAGKSKTDLTLPKMSQRQKQIIEKVSGLMIGAFAIFTLIAIVSFFFTWKEDQSLLTDTSMMSQDVHVNNFAGKLGYKWGYFLVARCFGLGSISIFFLFASVSMKLFFRKEKMSFVRTLLVSVSGAFIFSLFFAYISDITGAVNIFGSGLGGDCGMVINLFLVNLTGRIVTFVFLCILIVMWLLLLSGRFSEWLLKIGQISEKDKDVVPCTNDTETTENEDIPENQIFAENDTVVDETAVQEEIIPEQEVIHMEDETEPEPESVKPPVIVRESKVSESASVIRSEDTAPSELKDESIEVVSGDGFSSEVTKELPRIDNREELENFQFPPLDLLDDYASGKHDVSSEELDRNNNKIRATLLSYKIQVEKVTACVGPTVTLYKVVPAPGVKISAIKNLDQDIAMALNANGVRVVRLPGSVGIEVANDRPSIVPLKSMLNDDAFRNSKADLPVAIGYTITQKVKVFDLADAPHLLVAGATKQGKSVGLNVIITSLLYAKHPTELKFVFIDPKMVEFTAYSRLLKHYLAVLPDAADEKEEMDRAIIKSQKQAEEVLRSLCIEMDDRYKLLSKAEVNNIKLYNNKFRDRHLFPTEGHKYLPYIVVVIDEYADLIMSGGMGGDSKNMSRSITTSIIRLAQKGRAAGIHVIIATQRPSVDVITGLIKTNFPTRIAFRVSTRPDSSTILDAPGAERLIGKGDMLYYAGVDTERVQCALVDIEEITAVTKFIESQRGYKKSYNTPYYLPAVNNADEGSGSGMIDMQNVDSMFEDAARLVVTSQQGSTTSLQRKLGMGYARAGKVMDQLEAAGIVGPQEGSKARQVLVADLAELEPILKAFLG